MIDVPKRKPDILHAVRFEMNEKERELLEAYIGGTLVRNAVVPATIAAGVASASYIGYKAAKAAFGWTEDIVEEIKSTPIGGYAASVAASDGQTLPNPGLRGLYKLFSWLGTSQGN